MSKTYSQVMKQIDALQREAEELRRKEVEGVIVRIKEAIRAYDLKASDLGLGKLAAARAAKPGRKGRKNGKTARRRTVVREVPR